jgi:hypothetical protein
LEEAVFANFPQAQFALAAMLTQGSTIPADPERAKMLLQACAKADWNPCKAAVSSSPQP